MSASLGGVSACATKAGSSAASARMAASASSRPLVHARRLAGARSRATLSTSSAVASVCTACQRLKGSLSCAARRRRSSASDWRSSLIGAEKPRLIESTGRSATPVNMTLAAGSLSTSTPRSIGRRRQASAAGRGRPCRRGRCASGITIGSLRRLAGRRREICADRAGRSWRRRRSGRRPPPPACRPANTSA